MGEGELYGSTTPVQRHSRLENGPKPSESYTCPLRHDSVANRLILSPWDIDALPGLFYAMPEKEEVLKQTVVRRLLQVPEIGSSDMAH